MYYIKVLIPYNIHYSIIQYNYNLHVGRLLTFLILMTCKLSQVNFSIQYLVLPEGYV